MLGVRLPCDFSKINAVQSCRVVRKVRTALPPIASTWADRAKRSVRLYFGLKDRALFNHAALHARSPVGNHRLSRKSTPSCWSNP